MLLLKFLDAENIHRLKYAAQEGIEVCQIAAVMLVSSGMFTFWVVWFFIVYYKIKRRQTPRYVLCMDERKTYRRSDIPSSLAEEESRQPLPHPAWFVIGRLQDVLGQNDW